MSKKTFKRVALGVVVSMVLAPFAAIAPSQAAATTLTASTVTGTVAATASTSVATGTFSVTLVEDAGNVWADDAEITLQLVDKFGVADTCTIAANTDGSPAGTVTITGVSDVLFSVAGYEPTLEVVSGDLVVSIEGDYTDGAELEHIVISGLTARCTSTAPLGNIYVAVTGGTGEIDPANVVMTGSVNREISAVGTNAAVRLDIANFPAQAAYEATNNIYAAFTNISATKVRETVSAMTVSALWTASSTTVAADFTANADGEDVFVLTNHGLRTGDAVRMVTETDELGNFSSSTTYRAIVTGANTFQLASTLTNAVAGTRLEFTADGNVELRYAGSGMPVSLTIGSATGVAYEVGSVVSWPASAAVADAFGAATSRVYLGKVGTVGATFQYYSTGTQTAFDVNTNLTTTATAGEINVVATTAGAILDGATSPTVVITLTNGVFQSAPTVNGATISGSQVYPSATLTLVPTTEAIDIVGTYRFNAGTAAGSYLTFVAAVNNLTAPVGFIGSALAQPSQNRIAILTAATGKPATPASLSTGAANVAGAVVTTTETAAGTFRSGHYVAICFADATGNDLFDTTSKFVWATVTTGDLKLEGNVTTLRASMTNDVGVTAYDGQNNQCAQVRVFSASTAVSTITWSAGTATAAESAVPFNMSVGTANGVIRMGIVAGASATGGQVYGTFNLGTRTTANNYSVAVGSAASVLLPAAGAAMPNITITEAARGRFAAGTITIQLSNSLGVDNNISAFTATSGADAPVVTQTAATSDIAWTYAVIADRVTITIASSSTNVPAQFVISNIKLNVASTTASGLAVTDNDIFAVVSGNAVASNSWYTKLSNVTAPEVVVDPVAPELAITKNNGRIFLTGLCQIDEGDVVVYVKTPGQPWKELAKTAECFAGAFDADRMAPKTSKLYRVKQEGTGLFSNQVLVRP